MHCIRMQHCCSAAAKLQQLLLLSPSYIARSVSLSATQQADATVQGPYISQPVQHVEQVPVPLSRRPAQHTAQLSALMQWRQNVLDAIKQIKDTFVAEDEGPSTSELQAWRELDSQQWQTCSWQQLDMELSAAVRRSKPTQDWQVLLRAPVQDLEQLWRLRLEDRVPFQYLIATAHWRDLVLSVGPGILVPRPETELIVDLAAAALQANPALGQLPWADLGTGSGALAIGTAQLLLQQEQQQQQGKAAVQQERGGTAQPPPAAQLYAVDLSPTAVAYATANAAACGVQEAVQAVQGSWFEPLQHLKGQLGGVLSNPPYIPRSQIEAGLQAEVGQHEPMSALDGGPGAGMDSLQVICEQAVWMLAPGGYMVLETAGAEQAPLVQKLLQSLEASGAGYSSQQHGSSAAAFTGVTIHDDCYGVPRFVSATRSL